MLFLDRGEHYACAFPSRSYVVTARVEHALPHASLLHVATGDKKCGLTSGTLADMLTADAIAGRDNPWASPSAQRA